MEVSVGVYKTCAPQDFLFLTQITQQYLDVVTTGGGGGGGRRDWVGPELWWKKHRTKMKETQISLLYPKNFLADWRIRKQLTTCVKITYGTLTWQQHICCGDFFKTWSKNSAITFHSRENRNAVAHKTLQGPIQCEIHPIITRLISFIRNRVLRCDL